MHHDGASRGRVRHFFHEAGSFFRAPPGSEPILEWRAEAPGTEVLVCDGMPVARLDCNDRRWTWRVLDDASAPMRAGSEAEARLLARFYARRLHG
ncbi:hypothetical protein V5F29_00735 [Xanthobacter aminoxidans]|uniref:hypothetical protein n=1 Tax=Xanthobacter aminoxidans TaxID=186280 RepID=UPI003728CCD1